MTILSKIEEVDGKKVVTQSAVFSDEDAATAFQFLKETLNDGGTWIDTSNLDGSRSKNARVGDTYDSVRGVFIPPKPSSKPSYVFNEKKWIWVPPVPHPTDRYPYLWNENELKWVKIEGVPPVPASWTYDPENDLFVPPVPKPSNDKKYRWDEPTVSWVEVVKP